MTHIPLVLFEEHHDAYFLWHSAIQRGWMASRANTLLHVDSHSDMVLPILRSSLPEVHDLSAVQQFTYTALDISTFILPAVHQRIFNRVVYMRSQHPSAALGWRRLTIALEPDGQLNLHRRTGSDFEQADSIRPLDYARITPRTPIDTDQPIVLDIDLDFFCTNENPCPPNNQIETTQAVYEDVRDNPYHLLRLIPRLNAQVIERGGRYFIGFYNLIAKPTSPEEERAAIHSRMDDLIAGLQSSAVRPVLISLCRSYYSGYTPARWVDYIQELLLTRLAQLYAVEMRSLHEIPQTQSL